MLTPRRFPYIDPLEWHGYLAEARKRRGMREYQVFIPRDESDSAVQVFPDRPRPSHEARAINNSDNPPLGAKDRLIVWMDFLRWGHGT